MIYPIITAILLALTASSCGPRFCDYFPYHEDGRSKPALTILPIVDRSNSDLAWNVSQELDQDLLYRLRDDGAVFLTEDNLTFDEGHPRNENYFGADLSFAKKYRQGEFVVVMELIEHEKVPYEKGKILPIYPIHNRECDFVLMMKLRIRIIDVRCEVPKIILQEIVQSNHMMPRNGDNVDYTSFKWGTDAYTRTPLAQAHQRLAYDVAYRIESIALGAK